MVKLTAAGMGDHPPRRETKRASLVFCQESTLFRFNLIRTPSVLGIAQPAAASLREAQGNAERVRTPGWQVHRSSTGAAWRSAPTMRTSSCGGLSLWLEPTL
jgi:hypothetical protein